MSRIAPIGERARARERFRFSCASSRRFQPLRAPPCQQRTGKLQRFASTAPPPKSGKNHGAPMAMVQYSHAHRKTRERTQQITTGATSRPGRNIFISIPPGTSRKAPLCLQWYAEKTAPLLPAKRRMQA